ncbi:MAG: hypothetical protein Sylvanvirus44_2 [Sylvanvirus sp.]|uniref:Uncharacterized protein n=1 Tax=Sylvanvirus sp. TaxID=2487774 RepID=A0A3G5AJ57_9VIRU|nr:MAG: hypothetical protein Sylvanvirus44_2 [Sylvanvirus sp.]
MSNFHLKQLNIIYENELVSGHIQNEMKKCFEIYSMLGLHQTNVQSVDSLPTMSRLVGILMDGKTENATLQCVSVIACDRSKYENDIYFSYKGDRLKEWIGNWTRGYINEQHQIVVTIYLRTLREEKDISSDCICDCTIENCIDTLDVDEDLKESLHCGNLSLFSSPDTSFARERRWSPSHTGEELDSFHRSFIGSHREHIRNELQQVDIQLQKSSFIPAGHKEFSNEDQANINKILERLEDQVLQVGSSRIRSRAELAWRRFQNIDDAIFILSPHNWNDPHDGCHNYQLKGNENDLFPSIGYPFE